MTPIYYEQLNQNRNTLEFVIRTIEVLKNVIIDTFNNTITYFPIVILVFLAIVVIACIFDKLKLTKGDQN